MSLDVRELKAAAEAARSGIMLVDPLFVLELIELAEKAARALDGLSDQ